MTPFHIGDHTDYMRPVDAVAKEFLSHYGMGIDAIDFDAAVASFLDEMKNGLERKSSLPMLPTFIEIMKDIPAVTSTIVLDAGGTNFRSALVETLENGTIHIKKINHFPMPGSKGNITKDRFFLEIAQRIIEMEMDSHTIGFSFCYEAEILPDGDARVKALGKEIQVTGIEGELLAENIIRMLQKRKINREYHMVILNDATATLLAARSSMKTPHASHFVGFILGTGFNCSYIEKNENIKKISGLDHHRSQIINVESACFSLMQRGRIDIEFDRTTKNPGYHQFEKMVSGAYFGPLCHQVLLHAADDKLFSPETVSRLKGITPPTTAQLSAFAQFSERSNPLSLVFSGTEADYQLALSIIENLTERNAKCAAVSIAASVLKTAQHAGRDNGFVISCDGSVFKGLSRYNERVENYLKEHLTRKQRISFSIVIIDNATLIGAAIAALTNSKFS